MRKGENKEASARDWHKLILIQAKNEKWSNKNKENHGDNIPTEQARSDNVPESITWGMYYVRHLPSSLPSVFGSLFGDLTHLLHRGHRTWRGNVQV